MKKFNLTKKMLALALGVLMLLSVMTGCGKTNDQAGGGSSDTQQEQTGALLKKIKDSGKLVVGTEAQYAPYEFKDLDANFVGCDMWLAQQIADSLGVKLEIVDMSFDGIIPAVQSGQVDLGIAAFTNTPERAKEIDFSNLYETSAQLLIVKTGNADVYSTKESLVGQKVGAQKGTIQSQLIQSALPDSELFELELASAGVTRSYMSVPCDMYFTMERKIRRYLSCCFRLYCVPEKEYAPYVERVLQTDLHQVAENIVAETVQNAAAAFAATMGAAADEN